MDVREKLVELLRGAPYNIFGNKLGNCYFDSCLELIADYLITNGVTVQEWISVKDRLPEDGVRVLAAHDDGVVRIGICRGCFPAVMSKNHEKAFGFAEVTHWMPIPEPPKGE